MIQRISYDLVAQWIEHRLAEPGAAGSNPAEITIEQVKSEHKRNILCYNI